MKFAIAAASGLALATLFAGQTSTGRPAGRVATSGAVTHYALTNLGTLNGTSSAANSINASGWAAGVATKSADQVRATLWRDAQPRVLQDLGTLGGPNSAIQWPNHNTSGLIAGISETAALDPLREAWSCSAFFVKPTYHVCRGFRWRNGVMTELPTLGGINGYAAGTNNAGQIVGWAENQTHDPTCRTAQATHQVLQFKPVFWTPDGGIHQLPTLAGDPDGAATATNDRGEIVGISGMCDQAVGRYTARHAVIWHDGDVTEIGPFPGVAWNTPQSINREGDVVGFANTAGGDPGAIHPFAFLWKGGRLYNLGTLPGNRYAFANGINDEGQVVGESFGGMAPARAFIWQDNVMTDLNEDVPAGSHLFLNSASDINDRGEIVGQATLAGTSQTPAFLAVPASR